SCPPPSERCGDARNERCRGRGAAGASSPGNARSVHVRLRQRCSGRTWNPRPEHNLASEAFHCGRSGEQGTRGAWVAAAAEPKLGGIDMRNRTLALLAGISTLAAAILVFVLWPRALRFQEDRAL